MSEKKTVDTKFENTNLTEENLKEVAGGSPFDGWICDSCHKTFSCVPFGYKCDDCGGNVVTR